jgi:hypothetical protein
MNELGLPTNGHVRLTHNGETFDYFESRGIRENMCDAQFLDPRQLNL